MEILSPVKDYDSAKVAIQSGADAIYCAPPKFGARVNASIDLEELKNIIYYANLYDVKVYITFNTVIFNDELEDFFYYLDQIYLYGADGILIQDIGLIKLVKNNYPDLEIHCSTQMNINNLSAINGVKGLGVNRVVLPREMNLDKIKYVRENTDVELEVFGHGALCVSYSGLCFDSTLLDQKSANRGRCSQYCRMEQEIINKKTNKSIRSGHPLNLKDLNTTSLFKEYQEVGIDSFKIEGRLKQPEYVMVNTMNYTNLRDHNKLVVDPHKVYNREFTTGRVSGVNGGKLVNLNRPNNNGYYVGEVVDIHPVSDKKYKYYKNEIVISTKEVINKLDNLRFITTNDEVGQIVDICINNNDNTYTIYSNLEVEVGNKVYRTVDNSLVNQVEELTNTFNKRVKQKVLVDIDNRYFIVDDKVVNFDLNLINDQNYTTSNHIIDMLSKTKNTMFDLDVNLIYNEPINILNKSIKGIKKLILQTIVNNKLKHRESKLITNKQINNNSLPQNDKEFFVEVRTKQQYETVVNRFAGNVVINNIDLAKEIIPRDNDYLLISRVVYDEEFEEIDEVVSKFNNLVVGEIGSLYRYNDLGKNIITNFTFNTTNSISQQFLQTLGVNNTYLSIELNNKQLKNMANTNSIVGIYGRIPVMIMDYCPINHNKTNTCGSCRACRNGDYYLHDKLDRKFPLLYEGNNRIGMYANKPMLLDNELEELQEFGFNKFYISFTDEKVKEIDMVLDKILYNKEVAIKTNTGSYYKRVL